MDSLREKFINDILCHLKSNKISSIVVNGRTIDDYKKLDLNENIETLFINKKYIKLFEEKYENFILENFIQDKDMIVKNLISGKYIKLKISHHARMRLLTRYLLLMIKFECTLNTNKDIFKDLNLLLENFLNDDNTKNIKDKENLLKILTKMANENIDILNKTIYKMFIKSSLLKNISRLHKKREKSHGATNFYVSYPFSIVYDVKSSLIKTIEIHEINKKDMETKYIRQLLNKKTNDIQFIYKLLKQKIKG